jgi:hypothetical protein
MSITTIDSLCFKLLSCSKNFRWTIRIGSNNHNSRLNATKVLDIVESKKHDKYDGRSSYYDVGLLKTNPVNFSEVIRN